MSGGDSAICRDDSPRRAAVRGSGKLTGLDYLEVDQNDRRKLKVVFIGRLPEGVAGTLTTANFSISGGRRTRDLAVVRVDECSPTDPELDDCLTLTVDRIGDFSTYTLCVVETKDGRPTGQPHPAFDPRYACLDFTFTAGCPSDLDCQETPVCPPPVRPRPAIDYLAKDYESFRQLMLDRLAVLVPGWTERHVPDLMLTLVELLAYEGDRLSYLQDAVATEAYLHTARQRISVRRHARLVDYFLQEGCNARAWVFVKAEQDTPPIDLADLFFTTLIPGTEPGKVLTMQDLSAVADDAYEVFEPMIAPPSAGFDRRSVRDPGGLCRRLLAAKDPVARFLRDRMQPAVVAELRAWNGAGDPPLPLLDDVLAELNRLAREQTLYDEKVFVEGRMSQKTRQLRQAPATGRMVELNQSALRDQLEGEMAAPGTVRFYAAHDAIQLYTWGERECCLPAGATSASLLDECPESTEPPQEPGEQTPAPSPNAGGNPAQSGKTADQPPAPRRCLNLQPGDYLLFEEVLGPHTGRPEDADPSHRHVVRLTGVTAVVDPVLGHPVLEVEWAPEDALPFPVCISTIGPAPCCALIENVSVARGNVLLVDHGRRMVDELPPVEVEGIQQPCEDDCPPERQLEPAPYRPTLSRRDLTFAAPLVADAPAAAAITQDPRQAVPSISLTQVSLAPPDISSPDPLARYRAPLLPTAFDREDVLSTAPLAKRLKADDKSMDPLTAYITSGLDAQTLDDLKAWDPAGPVPTNLAEELRQAVNALLGDPALDTAERFPDAGLDAPTLALRAARPLPADLDRLLSRWLLEQAVPDVLAPSRRFVLTWAPSFDLLEAGGDDLVFVVEMTDDRRARLRFGDGDLGEEPEPVSRFRALYRVGSGTAGNVGAEAIRHAVFRQGAIGGLTPRNPLAARGGTEPEPLDSARLRAPYAIRRDLERAVTGDDYAALAARDYAAELQGAAASLVWTGSWYAARVGLDPTGREEASPGLIERVFADLEKYRRMGHDLEVVSARYVPLAIRIRVCVKPGYQTAHVLAALRDAFGRRRRRDGSLGFFHPDNLRFGQGVAASQLTAVAQGLAGVQWALVEQLERMGEGDHGELAAGYLPIAPTEIARVDSDPGFPEDGAIDFAMDGGR